MRAVYLRSTAIPEASPWGEPPGHNFVIRVDPVGGFIQTDLHQMSFPGFHPPLLFTAGDQKVFFQAPVHEDAERRRVLDSEGDNVPNYTCRFQGSGHGPVLGIGVYKVMKTG